MAYWGDETHPKDEERVGSSGDDLWGASGDEKPQITSTKKKSELKAKIAEKDARRNVIADVGDRGGVTEFIMSEAEIRQLEKQRELEEDMKNASDLLGVAKLEESPAPKAPVQPAKALSATTKDSPASELDVLLTADPKTREDFAKFSQQIFDLVIKRHQNKPQYTAFVEHHSKALAGPLKDQDVRKVATALNTMLSERQKKPAVAKKASSKPTLGQSKSVKAKLTYDDDGFGDDPDDFM